jgi:hypothetical protein
MEIDKFKERKDNLEQAVGQNESRRIEKKLKVRRDISELSTESQLDGTTVFGQAQQVHKPRRGSSKSKSASLDETIDFGHIQQLDNLEPEQATPLPIYTTVPRMLILGKRQIHPFYKTNNI